MTSRESLVGEMARLLAAEVQSHTGTEPFPHIAGLARPHAAAACGFPRTHFLPGIADYSFIALDLTIDRDGWPVLIETNGSNSAFSSSPFGNDELRAAHAAEVILTNQRRLRADRPAALFGFQKGFHFCCEYFPRLLATAIHLADHFPTAIHRAGEPLDAALPLVVGTTEELAALLRTDAAGRLRYLDREVVFIQNPNILPAAIRQGTVPRDHVVDVLHDGRLCSIVHDKGLQQKLCESTGIRPLRFAVADDPDEFRQRVAEFHADGLDSVAKMNSGSGGCGIEVFPADLDGGEVETRMKAMIGGAVEKYGDEIGRTMWPVRLFEFARSRPLIIEGHEYAWDMRFPALQRRGQVTVYPAVIRRAPEPFSIASREGWVTNLSGRRRSMANVYSALDETVLAAAGIDVTVVEDLTACVARWCESAWRYCDRIDADGQSTPPKGDEFEDVAAARDPHFYLGRRT